MHFADCSYAWLTVPLTSKNTRARARATEETLINQASLLICQANMDEGYYPLQSNASASNAEMRAIQTQAVLDNAIITPLNKSGEI